MATAYADDPEQDKWLDDANENVKKQAFYMKRALDSNNVRDALKCASAMTGELRTAKLSPKNYYELYMIVTDELREMELFFEDECQKHQNGQGGRSVVELYENVQHAGNIVPRLYLLITVASVYIKSKIAPAKDILIDLVELCRGVQHPMRGLFLRNYLSQISKNKLPDEGSEYLGTGGEVSDSIEFILQNFSEMNKLWVRMQHQGAVRDRARREKERRNLRQLVGTNLVRLSEMRGVDLETYKDAVLPRVLGQIVDCKDTIAQEYLMDCVIQVFPDDFHLQTLETFLSTCGHLHDAVNVKNIIITLMNRLSNFAKETPEAVPEDIEMFPLFHKHTSKIIQSSAKMPLVDVLSLQVALVNFATKCYPERLQYIDQILAFSVTVLEKAGREKVGPKCIKQVVQLLSLPLESLSLKILELDSYDPLMSYLQLEQKKMVATNIVKAVVAAKEPLDTLEKVETLFRYVEPLIKDEEEGTMVSEEDQFQFDQNQHLMARAFRLVGNEEDTDLHFKLYDTARIHFGRGGTQRIEYTLPPLVFGSLQLAKRVRAREVAEEPVKVKTKKLFGFVHETIGVLSPHYPELALRLFVYGAQVADTLEFEAIAYEFVAQAIICYEEQLSDSKAQFLAMNYIVAALQNFTVFAKENYDTLINQAANHGAKLLKKTDQCRAVYNCSHLFWPGTDENPGHRDEKRVLICLQRALKIANTSMNGNEVPLFVEILNKYLYFFDRGCPAITVKYLKGLIALIDEHMEQHSDKQVSKATKIHYENTKMHIKMKQTEGDDTARYAEINDNDEEEEEEEES